MQVEQGTLIPSTLKPVGKGITGAQHAMVHINALSQKCIVKKVGHREIAAECFCALLGHHLSLPTLIPVLITNPDDDSLWFGARNNGYPNLSSYLGPSNKTPTRAQLANLARILSTWAHIGQAVSFDEIIVNGDRNPGNVLWNGKVFTLIDHERALGNQPKLMNKIAHFATQHLTDVQLSSIQNATVSAAMAQQALLNTGTSIWNAIQTEFTAMPSEVGQHFAAFQTLAQLQLPSIVTSASNAVTPLLTGYNP